MLRLARSLRAFRARLPSQEKTCPQPRFGHGVIVVVRPVHGLRVAVECHCEAAFEDLEGETHLALPRNVFAAVCCFEAARRKEVSPSHGDRNCAARRVPMAAR